MTNVSATRIQNTGFVRSMAAILLCVTFAITGQPGNFSTQTGAGPRLVLIIVMDGLRPDSINREDTPTLFRLRQEGVSYVNSHSVFPTVTRVNAAAISTGYYPDVNGLVSNAMFVPGVLPNRAFNTSDYRQLLKMRDVTENRLLFVDSLAERLRANGLRFVAVSSGSTGSALLLNHRAPEGVGVLINGGFEPGKRVAYPDDVSATVLSRFGSAPTEEDSTAVDWADRVLRDYVLPDLKPDVLIDWQTEPDGAQHRYGVGSSEARKALANNDRNLKLTLEKLNELGIADKTDLMVISDHGFSVHDFKADATQALIKAGLKSSTTSDDVVFASNGQSILIHVKNSNSQRIQNIVRFLQQQDWVDVIFTSSQRPTPDGRYTGRKPRNEYGWIAGTFSLELIRQTNAHRGPDILFTMPWSSGTNSFGAPGKIGTDGSGNTGAMTGDASGHGGLSPWTVRNTLVLWGPDFKRGATVRIAAGNVDIAPTVLKLKKIPGAEGLGGRVLVEALRDGPDPEKLSSETKTLTTGTGLRRSFIQVTDVGDRRYIDKAWRTR